MRDFIFITFFFIFLSYLSVSIHDGEELHGKKRKLILHISTSFISYNSILFSYFFPTSVNCIQYAKVIETPQNGFQFEVCDFFPLHYFSKLPAYSMLWAEEIFRK